MIEKLERIRDLIQEDVNGRGLRAEADRNLINACPGDFLAACRSIAETPKAAVGVITGFLIPHAQPAAGETDGPLGALFLARALTPLGIWVLILTDQFCENALVAGLTACGFGPKSAWVGSLPPSGVLWSGSDKFPFTHMIALERVGPSHTLESLRAQTTNDEALLRQFQDEVPPAHQDRCHTMRGGDITDQMTPVHRWFESVTTRTPPPITIGIGDGGNEIGMGKIPWDVIRRNIPNGGLIACRVPTDYLIVCGVSNWGAYGLAAGVSLLKGKPLDPELFDPERERALLQIMVEQGPLVDGVTGRQTATVDGLDFDRYAAPLRALRSL
jgi:hypothetical protein